MTPFTGGCACGAIRYEIAAEPLLGGHCQCRDCQRMTGTGHSSFMAFPATAARVTGAAKFHDVTADSGNRVGRGFCPDCGCFLFERNSGMPGMLAVTAGSLDDPGRFVPQVVIFAPRGHAWDAMDPALPRFPGMPPSR